MKKFDIDCVLIIDGCFFGGMFGFFIGYVFFEVVEGGIIVFVEDGDMIKIDVLIRLINFDVLDVEFEFWKVRVFVVNNGVWELVVFCECKVFKVLKVYVYFVISVVYGVVCKL